MGQSLAKNLIHLIFSTKDRHPSLMEEVRDDLQRYMAGIFRDLESPAIAINSVADHVHVLFDLSKNEPLAKVVMEVKRGSSKWLKTKHPDLQRFQWQNGYGAFSVGQSQAAAVEQYTRAQEEHHRRKTFQDELREFLARYKVDFDERYLWD